MITELDKHIIAQLDLLSNEGKKHVENMFSENKKRVSKKESLKRISFYHNY